MQGLLNGCKSDRLGTTSLANNCVFLLQPILGVLLLNQPNPIIANQP